MSSLRSSRSLSTASPSVFAEKFLGKEGASAAYDWQRQAMDPFENIWRDRVKVTVASPNGSGRSSYCIADTALSIVAQYPLGRAVLTTADGKQMDNQIWPAIEAHKGKFPHWTWRDREVTTDTGGQLVAFVTDEAGRAEGWHRLPGATQKTGPLFMAVDEAKSFEEDKFVALDRCSYDGLMLSSSTGLMEGRFFDSHHSLEGFVRVRAGLLQCPHIKQEKIDDIIRTYGENSPVTRSILHAEFMNFDGVSKFVFQLEHLANARASTPRETDGDTVAFCDFAAGGDENVLAIRRGNKVAIQRAWRDEDTMRAVGSFIFEFRKAGLKATQIFGDNTGLGHVMIDAMAEQGWTINRVDNASKANSCDYTNRGAEFWHECAGMVRRGEIILPLDDPQTYKQLAGRKVDWSARGLGVESKKDMANRGVSSPDRADAVCAAAVLRDIFGKLSESQRVDARVRAFRAHEENKKDAGSYAHLMDMN